MKIVLLLLTGFSLGALSGTYLYQTVFNPEAFLKDSYTLAQQSFIYGCALNKGQHCFEQGEKFRQDLDQAVHEVK